MVYGPCPSGPPDKWSVHLNIISRYVAREGSRHEAHHVGQDTVAHVGEQMQARACT